MSLDTLLVHVSREVLDAVIAGQKRAQVFLPGAARPILHDVFRMEDPSGRAVYVRVTYVEEPSAGLSIVSIDVRASTQRMHALKAPPKG